MRLFTRVIIYKADIRLPPNSFDSHGPCVLIERKRKSVLTRRWSPLKGLYLGNCPAASPGGRYGQYGPVSCFKLQQTHEQQGHSGQYISTQHAWYSNDNLTNRFCCNTGYIALCLQQQAKKTTTTNAGFQPLVKDYALSDLLQMDQGSLEG